MQILSPFLRQQDTESEEEIRKCLEQAIRGKPKMHHFEEQNLLQNRKNMSQIGG